MTKWNRGSVERVIHRGDYAGISLPSQLLIAQSCLVLLVACVIHAFFGQWRFSLCRIWTHTNMTCYTVYDMVAKPNA